MNRLTQLEAVLFPVAERPIYVLGGPAGDKWTPITNKKAIINTSSGQAVGVVGHDYRLVTNHQALDWGVQCCLTVLPNTHVSEWTVNSVDAPSTAGYCRIDLAHKLTTLNLRFDAPQGAEDVYGPFIRVTNSYNALRALTFDVGFARMICSNGVIFPEEVIKFRFAHSRREIGELIQFKIDRERFSELKVSLGEYIKTLRSCAVPKENLVTFALGVLKIGPSKALEFNGRSAEAWQVLKSHIAELCDRYAGELGHNAYAVFNVVTEFASHPLDSGFVRRERHSSQRLVGDWLRDFSGQCRRPGFNLTEYIDSLLSGTIKEKSQSGNKKEPMPVIDRVGAGEQHVLPGAERTEDAALLKRRAERPLTPKAKQKPADAGLFSDDSKQIDLIDQLNAKDKRR